MTGSYALAQLGGAKGAAVVGVYLALLWLPAGADVSLYVLIALTLWVVLAVGKQPPRGFAEGADPWVALFMLSLGLAVAASTDWRRSLALSIGFVPAALCYLLLTRYTRDARRLPWVFLGAAFLSLAVALAVIIAFGRHVIGTRPLDPQTLVDQVGLSLLVVPNDSLLLALNLPLILAVVLVWRRPLVIGLGVASIIASVAVVVLLQSRAALLCIVVGVAVTGLLARRRRSLVYLAVAASAGATVVAIDAALGFALLHKLTGICNNRDALWAAAWSLFAERPLLGQGPFTFKELYADHVPAIGWLGCELRDTRVMPWPHNLYLELLAGHGLLGALAFAALLVWVAVALGRALRGPDRICRTLAVGLTGAFCAFLVGAVFELSFIRFWVVVWFAVLIGATAVTDGCNASATDGAALGRDRFTGPPGQKSGVLPRTGSANMSALPSPPHVGPLRRCVRR